LIKILFSLILESN